MTEKINKIRELANDFRGINNRINVSPLLTELFEKYDVSQDLDIALTQYSYVMNPAPFNVETMKKLSPYVNPEKINKSFKGAVEREWLLESAAGQYLPTDKTVEFVEKLYRMLTDHVSEFQPIGEAELEQFSKLTQKVLETAGASEGLQFKEILEIERKFYEENASDYYKSALNISDLFVVRDIAHINSWANLDIQGYEWEAFSFIWKGEIKTASGIIEKRPNRGYAEQEYEDALNRLAGRGWIVEKDGEYVVSKEGKEIRDAAEGRTDDFFGLAFASLSETELDKLISLLEKLIEVLKPEAEIA